LNHESRQITLLFQQETQITRLDADLTELTRWSQDGRQAGEGDELTLAVLQPMPNSAAVRSTAAEPTQDAAAAGDRGLAP
jgi:hypothetical protein